MYCNQAQNQVAPQQCLVMVPLMVVLGVSDAPGGGSPGWCGGGVLGRRGVEGKGRRSSTLGQTHIWGFSTESGVELSKRHLGPGVLKNAHSQPIETYLATSQTQGHVFVSNSQSVPKEQRMRRAENPSCGE